MASIIMASGQASAGTFDELDLIRVVYMPGQEEVATNLGPIGPGINFSASNITVGGGSDAFALSMFKSASSWGDLRVVYFSKNHTGAAPNDQKEVWLATDSGSVPGVNSRKFSSFNGAIDQVQSYYRTLAEGTYNTVAGNTGYLTSFYQKMDFGGDNPGTFGGYLSAGFGEVDLSALQSQGYVDMYLYYFMNNTLQNGGSPVAVIRTLANGSTIINPGSQEVVNIYYQDADGDGYGNPQVSTKAKSCPSGYVENNTDCDDNDAAVHLQAQEICDGKDNDCDGEIDEGVKNTYYLDADADGFGEASKTVQACVAPSGYVADNTDCNDTDSTVHPGAAEVLDGKDNDCDGTIDEGVGPVATVSGTFDELELIRVVYMPGQEEVATDLGTIGSGLNLTGSAVSAGAGTDSFNLGMFRSASGWADVRITYLAKDYTGVAPHDQKDVWLALKSDTDTPAVSSRKFSTFNGGVDVIQSYYRGLTAGAGSTVAGGTGYVTSYYQKMNFGGSDQGNFAGYLSAGFGEADLSALQSQGYVDMYLYHFKNNALQNDGRPVAVIRTTVNADGAGVSTIINPAGTYPAGGQPEPVVNTWYQDSDGDGFGNNDAAVQAQNCPSGYVRDSTDCDDTDAAVHSGAQELCDRKDNNCDGRVDEGCIQGDINGDGDLTPMDALAAFQCYLGIRQCSDSADINGDGAYTPSDALCLFKKFLGQPGCLDLLPPSSVPMTYTEPYLLSLTPMTSMDVCWLTSEPTDKSYVEYGSSESYGHKVQAVTYEIKGMETVDTSGLYMIPLKVYQQIAHLENLEPGARYYYRAISQRGAYKKITQGYYFKTAPAAGTPVKFFLLSDLQLKPQIPSTVKLAGQQGADFIIYNGDLVNTACHAGEWFSVPGTSEEDDKRWFNAMQQTTGDTRLLQYTPIFPSPGNHEINEQERLTDKTLADRSKLSLKIYMQLFRTLYPEQQYEPNGKHWYSVDYADLHLDSLSILRSFGWPATEKPGWFMFDDIKASSPQYQWLQHDLETAKSRKYKWVTQHWHMYNRRDDVCVPYTDPVPSPDNPDLMLYPSQDDYLQRDIKPLFEKYGVNGVSFGHSHVYERYLINGVNYIEAASIGNTYRVPTDPSCSPNGYCPVFENCNFRSFLLVSIDPASGMTAQGIQASEADDGSQTGGIGQVFDTFVLAP